MKTIHIIFGLFVLAFLSIALITSRPAVEEWDMDLARVSQVEGKYVFVMSQPVHSYEEFGKVNTALMAFTDSDTGFDKLIKRMVRKGIKKEEKEGMAFDGMITEGGSVGVLIRFTE